MKIAGRQGFTLIELLVVIAIMAIVVGMATLSLRGADTDSLADRETRRLLQLIKKASDDAVLKNQQLGIRFNADGYDFYQLSDEQKWSQVEQQTFLKSHQYPLELETQLLINGLLVIIDDQQTLQSELEDKEKIKPQIMILSDGEIIPEFEVRFINPETQTQFILKPGNYHLIEYDKQTLDEQ